MPTPVVPVKALAEAKGRLAPALTAIERRLLVIAMLEDVLVAIAGTPELARAVVVSSDREILTRADALGCRPFEERPEQEGLNQALAAATASLDVSDGVVVVAADLPLATPPALGRVCVELTRARVVVVPSRDGKGTNVLGWHNVHGAGVDDPGAVTPAFGPGSAERHLGLAGAVRVDDAALALDVDTPDDLAMAVRLLDRTSVTWKRVRDLRLEPRLAARGEL